MRACAEDPQAPSWQESPFLPGGLRWLPKATAGPRLASSTTYWPPGETRRLRGHLSQGAPDISPGLSVTPLHTPPSPRPHPSSKGRRQTSKVAWALRRTQRPRSQLVLSGPGTGRAEQEMRRRGSRWAGAGRGTRRAGEGWAGAGGLCAVSLSSLGDTEVSGRGHVPATAGAKRCPHARQRHSSASSPTLGQRHLPGCSRDPAGVRGTFSGPCSVWLGESHKDGEETEGEGTGRGFPHDGMVHGSHASSPCEMAPQRGTLQVHSPLRRQLPGHSQKPTPCRAPERGPRLPPAWEECTGCR